MAGSSNPASHDGINPFFWLLLIASIVAMLGRRFRIPYALALVITGLLVGAPHLLPQARLQPQLLFSVFLPPLLFESAIHLRVDLLRRNWQPIALYAVLGTLISAFVVGGLMAWTLPLPIALVFGALISPTDPISVIAVFKRMGVGKRLSMLVEAESLFNDGVAVVLFGVLLEGAAGGSISLARGIQQALITVVGGAAVGTGIGALASRLTREFEDHLLEIMLTTVAAFGSYICAETVHVSGVIAVVAAGLVVGSYGMRTGMSPTTRLAVSSFWEYAAFAVNSIVFLLVGIEVTSHDLWKEIGPIAGAAAAMLVGRAAAIYVLSPVVNRLRGDVPLPWQHVLFWGGLRGALPMALVLGLEQRFPQRNLLVVLTFGVVLFSLLAQGLSIERLLKRLNLIEVHPREVQYGRLASAVVSSRAALEELERLSARGILPSPACEPVAQEYRERIAALEGQIEALRVSDAGLQEQQTGEARRLALMAEKSALQEARHSGLLDDEDHRRLVEEIDRRLGELGSPGRG
jgi:CPA1 family monovalent cation:H+ antiporter